MANNLLLEKVLIGEAITNYFKSIPTLKILRATTYANDSQGKVIAFDGTLCWKVSYSIITNEDNEIELELIRELSGVMDIYK